MLWKVLAGKIDSAKKVKTPHGFLCFLIVSHSGVGFWKVLALGLLFASHSAAFHSVPGLWKVLAVEMKSEITVETPHGFPFRCF